MAKMRRVPNVRAIRKAQGLSQAEFADRYVLSVGAVRDWEQGRYRPPTAPVTLLNVMEHRPAAVDVAIAEARRW